MTAYVDAHCHLQDPALAPALPEVLARARAAGVARLVCCGTGEADWAEVLALAREHREVVPMLGLHPWAVAAAQDGWLERLEALVRAHRAGVGECGLDFRPGQPERSLQESAFIAQARLAVTLDRPVAIHCVRAWERLPAILAETGVPGAGGLVHAYSGSAELVPALVRLGLHLSFGAALLRPEARRARLALAAVPADRLLFETDAPALAPPDWSGPNEPANAARVAEAAARLRGDPELPEQVRDNAERLFGSLA